LCQEHVSDVETMLGDLPALAHALDARYLRQQRFSVVAVTAPRWDDPERQEESRLPYDARAGRLRRELTRFLVRWVHRVSLSQPGAVPPRNTVESESGWLLAAVPWFRVHPDGAVLAAELASLHARVLEAVDRPPDMVYLGVCSAVLRGGECPEDIYSEWGEAYVRCRRCRTDHDVQARRDMLLSVIADQLATGPDIARGLSGLDMAVTPERIRQWKHRKRIVVRAPNHHGDPMYRVGDVIDLVLAENRRRRRSS
jgi:hypothetical protein